MTRRAVTTTFVGRDAAVAQLTAAIERAAAGQPTVVLVGGDAGVGKSRLLEQAGALASDRGATVVTTHCVDLGEIGLPYLPFAEALTQLTAATEAVGDAVLARPALARLLPALASSTGPAVEDDASRLQLFDGIAAVLAATGRPGEPLVLVVEDLHWADSSSRDVLRFLIARLRTEHILLIASYRTDDLHRRHPLRPLLAEMLRHPQVERLDLQPFTVEELRAFTTAVAGAPLPEPVLSMVAERSEGNAYFAEELLESGAEHGRLPWTLGEVLRSRLEQLDPAVQQLARVASAAGRRVTEPLLRAAALGPSPTAEQQNGFDASLREAVARHVLADADGQIAFRHALLAEVAYADLLPGERASLHGDYLHALSENPELGTPAEVAHHALQSHDLATALLASFAAARDAARVLAPAEELRHLETVLSLWEAMPDAAASLGVDRIEVALTAAAAASRAGRGDRAVALTAGAVKALERQAGGQEELVRLSALARLVAARTSMARYLLGVDRLPEALEQTAKALSELPDQAPSRDRAWALATHARAAVNLDRDQEAARAAEAAVEESRLLGEADAEADALATLAVLVVDDEDRAAELLATALRRARDAGDLLTELRCTYNLAANRYYAGRLDAAAAVTADGLAVARSTGLTWSLYGVELRLFAEIVRYASGDLSLPERTAGPVPETAASALAGVELYAAVARGDADALARGLALQPLRHSDPMITMIAGGCTVDALTWAGRWDEAVELALELIDEVGRSWGTYFLGGIWLSALAIAALADAAGQDRLAGRDPAARTAMGTELLAKAITTAERGRPRGGRLGPEGQAWLRRARAEHGRLAGENDPGSWESAATTFGVGYRYEEARSRWRWSEALLAAGDRAGALREAEQALREAEAMGAAPLAAVVRDLARRGRLDLPGVRHGSADVLTEREAEVLALVAQGLSNRQIGDRLFISAKTVSVHVSNLLAKLGASGRAEAVTVAYRRGLLGSD